MALSKKYFFFDIDGTLTDEATKKIVPSAFTALQKLQQAGHFVAIATGRAHYKARTFMEEVGLHNMVCCGGGALVVNDKLVHNKPFDLETAKALIKQADELGYGVLLMLDDSIDVHAKNDKFRQQVGERQEPTNYIIDSNMDYDKLTKVMKIYVSISAEEEYKLTLKDTLGHLRYVKDYLMFQYDEKHQGILDMLDVIHGDKKDVVVFGDDYNDLVMFDKDWMSIAMGNACDALKAKADFVTKKNVEDGIYYACEKFHWFDNVELECW